MPRNRRVFTRDRRYRRIYNWLEHNTETCEAIRKAHLSGLWKRLINQYIRPDSEREINITYEIRVQLMQLFHNRGDTPPPPEVLDQAVNTIKELLRGSILIPFLRRSTTTARVQSLSMPSLNDSLLEVSMFAPRFEDDIKVNKRLREDTLPTGAPQIVGTDSMAIRPRVLQKMKGRSPPGHYDLPMTIHGHNIFVKD